MKIKKRLIYYAKKIFAFVIHCLPKLEDEYHIYILKFGIGMIVIPWIVVLFIKMLMLI